MASLKGNIAQERAINSIYGPILLLSCPGSGKTTTMVRRIRRMVEMGVDPGSILMVTFGNEAAKEMEMRYEKMFGKNPGITFRTIHSLCLMILREEGVVSENAATVSETEKYSLLRGFLENTQSGNLYEMASAVANDIGRCVAYDMSPEEYDPRGCSKELFKRIMKQYAEAKETAGKLDFDDMLTKCRDYLRGSPKALSRWQNRFRFIQVDEYQDTSLIQKQVLYMLAGHGVAGKRPNICVVGDDDQSIYRFRGADNSIMMSFEGDFKAQGVQVIQMGTNYRSTQKVVDMASSCIVHNRKRLKKDFISDRGQEGHKGAAVYRAFTSPAEEMEYFVSIIKREHAQGVPYEDMAILCRTNKQADVPVQALASENIPFYSKDNLHSMYEKWMFLDIKAYVDLSMGIEEKTNLIKVLNRPNRFVQADRFRDVPFETAPMIEALEYKKSEKAWMYDRTVDSFNRWLNNFGPGKITNDTTTKVLLGKLVGKGSIQYDKYIKQVAQTRRIDEKELMDEFELVRKDALRFETVGQWFVHAKKITEWYRQKNRNKDKNGVRIFTMHKAKGLEWPIVFITGCNESVIPGRNAATNEDIEEERRILYVAMTRAKDKLYIGSTANPSRFITQTEETLNEKYRPVIKKKLAGALVEHKQYGRGKVAGYVLEKDGAEKSGRIAIRFDKEGEIRKFVFPDVFVSGDMKYLE